MFRAALASHRRPLRSQPCHRADPGSSAASPTTGQPPHAQSGRSQTGTCRSFQPTQPGSRRARSRSSLNRYVPGIRSVLPYPTPRDGCRRAHRQSARIGQTSGSSSSYQDHQGSCHHQSTRPPHGEGRTRTSPDRPLTTQLLHVRMPRLMHVVHDRPTQTRIRELQHFNPRNDRISLQLAQQPTPLLELLRVPHFPHQHPAT